MTETAVGEATMCFDLGNLPKHAYMHAMLMRTYAKIEPGKNTVRTASFAGSVCVNERNSNN